MPSNTNITPALYSLLDMDNAEDYRMITEWVQKNRLNVHYGLPPEAVTVLDSLTPPGGEALYKIMPWHEDGFSMITREGSGVYIYTPETGWSPRIETPDFTNYVFPWRGLCATAALRKCTLNFYKDFKQEESLDLKTVPGLEELATLNKAYAIDAERILFTGMVRNDTFNGIFNLDTAALEWLEKADTNTGGRIVRYNGYDVAVDYKMLRVFSNKGRRELITVLPVERRSALLPTSSGLIVLMENWKLVKYDLDFKPLFQLDLKESLTLDHFSYSPTLSYAGNTCGSDLYVSGYHAHTINKVRIGEHV